MNRKNIDVDTVTMDLFSDSASSDRGLLPLTGKSTLELLRRWSDAGLLRRLDVALAAFVQEQDPLAAPCVLVATALLAQMEGRGHSCLSLRELAAAPVALLGWSEPESTAVESLWSMLPPNLEEWLRALSATRVVRVVGQVPDQGQPLVLAGTDGDAGLGTGHGGEVGTGLADNDHCGQTNEC